MPDTSAVRRVVLPNEEWRELGRRRRREVSRQARRGRRHPDPYVAAVAHAWAAQKAVLTGDRPRTTVRSVAEWASWAALLVAVGAVLGDAAELLLPGGSDRRERRLARRILGITRS